MKPWGEIEWLLEKLPGMQKDLCLLGSIATEERCCAVPELAVKHGAQRIRLLRIADPQSRFSSVIKEKIDTNYRQLQSYGITEHETIDVGLFAEDEEIVSFLLTGDFLPKEGSHVSLWLDISSLPKRFFFLLTKLCLRDERVSDLIVTYVQPAPGHYTEEHLAEDPSDVQPLPGFGPLLGEADKLVVGVGFEALGIPQLLGEYKDRKRDIFLLIPFPPGQPYSRRIWETVRLVGHPGDSNIIRVPALDAFGTYEQLHTIFGPSLIGHRPPALAPYGPKPISLGMCLYAIDTGCPVYYTQPRVYHPNYTFGIGKIWSYCLKHKGQEMWRSSSQV